MFDLDEFVVVKLDSPGAFATLSLNAVIFNNEVITKMGKPAYVRLLLNEKEKCFAIKATQGFDDDKIEFCKDDSVNVRINNREFVRKLKLMIGAPEFGAIRVPGIYIESNKAFVFDLNRATPKKV